MSLYTEKESSPGQYGPDWKVKLELEGELDGSLLYTSWLKTG